MSDMEKMEALTEPEPEFLKAFASRDWAWFQPQQATSSLQGTITFDTLQSLNSDWVDCEQSFVWLQWTISATTGTASVFQPLCMAPRDAGSPFYQTQVGIGGNASNITSNVPGSHLWNIGRIQADWSPGAKAALGSFIGLAPDNTDAQLALQQVASGTHFLTAYRNNQVSTALWQPVINQNTSSTTGAATAAFQYCALNDVNGAYSGLQGGTNSQTNSAYTPANQFVQPGSRLNDGARQRALWMAGTGKFNWAAQQTNTATNYGAPLTSSQGANAYSFPGANATGTLYIYNQLVPLSMLSDVFRAIKVMKGQRLYIQGLYPQLSAGSATAATLSGGSGAASTFCPFILTELGDGSFNTTANTALTAIAANVTNARLYIRKVLPTPQVQSSALSSRRLPYRDFQVQSFLGLATGQQTMLISGIANVKRMFIFQFPSASTCPNTISPCNSLLCSEPQSGSTAGCGFSNVSIVVGQTQLSQNLTTNLFEQYAFFQRENLVNEGTDSIIASGPVDQYARLLNGTTWMFDLTKTRLTEEDLRQNTIRIQASLYGPTLLQDIVVVIEQERLVEITSDDCLVLQ